ncbi:MAG: RNA polymerase sigma-70 factor [Balneolales bacterium]
MIQDNKKYDEQELIDLLNKGDEQTFEKLFNEYYFSLARFAWRYTESEAIAEELVQDLFLEIWERRKTWKPFGKLRPCLYKIIKGKCLNYLKHQKVKRTYDSQWMEERKAETLSSRDIEIDEQLKQFVQSLNRAVEQLPHRCKMIYKLHRNDGLTYPEIAEIMDISHKTVESQMSRAFKLLREKLSHIILFMMVAFLL